MTAEAAIIGVGLSELSRYFKHHAGLLARDALAAAITDARLEVEDIDGLLLNISPLAGSDVRNVFGQSLQPALGMGDLKMLSTIDSQGATVGQMLGTAAKWLRDGGLRAVACLFADTPITAARGGASAYASSTQSFTGIPGLDEVYGFFGGPSAYALLASRFMHDTGATEEDFARVAITNRAWASGNDLAFMRAPLTPDEYFAARYVVQPLRLVDCALPVNGAACLILTAPTDPAANTRRAVQVLGRGQSHRALHWRRGREFGGQSAAAVAASQAYEAAGLGPEDMDIVEFYDAFSFVSLMMLEQYGFCGASEAPGLYANGVVAPGGRLPVNTGGGQTASFYLQGFTPIVEAMAQLRGEAGPRQVPGAKVGLVTFSGGVTEHHACTVLAARS